MEESKQGSGTEPESSEPDLAGSDSVHRSDPLPIPPPAPAPLDLRLWLLILALGGGASLILGQVELGLLVSLAAVFAVGHAADLRPGRETLYQAVAWVVPLGALMLFVSLGLVMIQADLPGTLRLAGLLTASLGALGSLASGLQPAAHALARILFRTEHTSHVLRLTARLALIGALFCVPASIAFPIAAEQISRSGGSLVGVGSLWANMVGLTVLALGGVGFRVRRDTRGTVDRLGLAPLRAAHLPVIMAGVIGLLLANAAAEGLQRSWFPSLWASDQRVNQMIAADLTRSDALLLGFSAGLGEELVLRGALQPRLGILPTAALFAVLHVQYSWFGIAIIAVLGLILGSIRRWTSTSAAIAVHVLYDILAVLALSADRGGTP
jgi:hypothetical protein